MSRAFLDPPLAHRGRHGPGVPENSRAAVRAACEQGWGIEIDVQLSADGQAMVFHDDTLDRMTGETGPVRDRSAAELGRIALPDGDGIPTLAEILALTAGRSALLIELKDQTGTLGPGPGDLERAAAQALRGYAGPVAVMSFNPYAVRDFGLHAPGVPRGLTTCAFDADDWPGVDPAHVAGIPMFGETGAVFISHQHTDLHSARVAELKRGGVPVLCWTIRSAAEEAAARAVADNVTFEGYTPGEG